MIKLFFTYIAIINISGFYLMYLDKVKAINNEWRIKEKTLLSIALFGGSIGTFLGMHIFRHKTKHIIFVLGVPFIIIFQIAILYFINIQFL